jgi:cell pole-organizing protein PopZ
MSVIAPHIQSPDAQGADAQAFDPDALARAQRAHEPSMEEILASIRAIIADDSTPAKPGPQLVYASEAPPRAPETPRKPEPDEPLVSEETGEAVAGSFRALAESMAAQSAKAAEDMAREMLRPMLKAWLDENMPPMVERLVKAEIQRLARGGR